MVKFYSLNVRGLRDQRKRKEIFEFFKRKNMMLYIYKKRTVLRKSRKSGKLNGAGKLYLVILIQELKEL